jgi:hypothetical protein
MRIYPLFFVQTMKFFTTHFDFEIEILIRLMWKGVEIKEVDINVYYPPADKRVSHFNKFWDNLRISLLNTVLVALSTMKTHRSPKKAGIAVGLGVVVGFVGLWDCGIGRRTARSDSNPPGSRGTDCDCARGGDARLHPFGADNMPYRLIGRSPLRPAVQCDLAYCTRLQAGRRIFHLRGVVVFRYGLRKIEHDFVAEFTRSPKELGVVYAATLVFLGKNEHGNFSGNGMALAI